MKLILFLLMNFVNGGFDLPGYAQKGRSKSLVPRQSTRKVSKILGVPYNLFDIILESELVFLSNIKKRGVSDIDLKC